MTVDLLGNSGHILPNCWLMDAHSGKEVNELHQNLNILISQLLVESDLLKGFCNSSQWSTVIINSTAFCLV